MAIPPMDLVSPNHVRRSILSSFGDMYYLDMTVDIETPIGNTEVVNHHPLDANVVRYHGEVGSVWCEVTFPPYPQNNGNLLFGWIVFVTAMKRWYFYGNDLKLSHEIPELRMRRWRMINATPHGDNYPFYDSGHSCVHLQTPFAQPHTYHVRASIRFSANTPYTIPDDAGQNENLSRIFHEDRYVAVLASKWENAPDITVFCAFNLASDHDMTFNGITMLTDHPLIQQRPTAAPIDTLNIPATALRAPNIYQAAAHAIVRRSNNVPATFHRRPYVTTYTQPEQDQYLINLSVFDYPY